MLPQRVTTIFCAAGLVGLILIPAARANIGPRWWGDVNTEPWGLKEVAIVHEQLTIDLRPLAALQPAYVEVAYDLNNRGVSKKLDLLFVSGEVGVRDFEARLGNEPVPARLLARDKLHRHWDRFPHNWHPPQRAPGIDWEDTFYMVNHWDKEATPVEFSLELPPGPSTLRVRYRARACGTDERYPTATWQFPYVLAPAREWGDFGRLDGVVQLPDAWQARSTPPLEREGATLRGSFLGLPADALLLATRAPISPEYRLAGWTSTALFILTSLGGGLLCWWVGHRHGFSWARLSTTEKGRGTQDTLALAIGLSLLWGAAVFLAGSMLPYALMRAALHGQEGPYFHELFDGLFCGSACLTTPAALLFGFTITLWSSSRSARRASTRVLK
jgi:hypothetical protein